MRFRAYLIVFVAVFLILIAANYYSYVQMGRGSCDDCFLHFGWPFPLWEEGGFVTVKRVLWAGLVANVSIAIWIALFFGSAVNFSRVKPSVRATRHNKSLHASRDCVFLKLLY